MVESGHFGFLGVERREIDLLGIASLSVDPAVCGDRGKPALNVAFAAVFYEQGTAVRSARDAIRPHVSENIVRFGPTGTARQEDIRQVRMTLVAKPGQRMRVALLAFLYLQAVTVHL